MQYNPNENNIEQGAPQFTQMGTPPVQSGPVLPPPAQLDDDWSVPVYGAGQGYQGAPMGYPGGYANGQNPYSSQGMVPPEVVKPEPETPSKKGYRTPGTGIEKPRKKKKKHPGLILCLIVALGFLAYAAIRLLSPQEAVYAYVQAGTLSSRYTGTGLIVRNETVYTQEGVSQIEYTAQEGAKVERTDAVCTVYTSGFNTKELTTLRKYRSQITEYHKTLINSTASSKDAQLLNLDSQVRTLVKETRLLIWGSTGSLTNQESLLTKALQARQTYLKQKYPDDQKLSRLYDDENTQMQRISSWTKQYSAAFDGLVSFYTDGFESALNLTNYTQYSPAEVRVMLGGESPSTGTISKNTVSIYRLVKNGSFAVLMLCDDVDWTPISGSTYKLVIESFEDLTVDATVESFTRSGGELLVRLMIPDADVSNVLYVRSCQVRLGEQVDSLSVPSRAIYSQYGQEGVVIVDQTGGNYWTPVSIVATEGEYTYIIPSNSAYLYEGVMVRLF